MYTCTNVHLMFTSHADRHIDCGMNGCLTWITLVCSVFTSRRHLEHRLFSLSIIIYTFQYEHIHCKIRNIYIWGLLLNTHIHRVCRLRSMFYKTYPHTPSDAPSATQTPPTVTTPPPPNACATHFQTP
jgi:hypothetical protein